MSINNNSLARLHWTFSITNAFYIGAQVDPVYAVYVVMALIIGIFIFDPNYIARCWSAQRDRLIWVFAVIAYAAFQALAFDYSFKATTAAHFASILLLVMVPKEERHIVSYPLIVTVTILNFLLIFTYFMSFGDLFWVENIGAYRFKSYFIEPSVAALFYAFTIVYIFSLSFEKRPKNFIPIVLMNILMISLTASGSGFFIIACSLLFIGGKRYKISTVLGIFSFVIIIGLLLLGQISPEQYQILLGDRIDGILTGNVDNSISLRFIAPWQLLGVILDSISHGMFGAGIGGLDSYVVNNLNWLTLFENFDRTTVVYVNNGYIAGFATLGLIGIIPFAIYLWSILKRLWKNHRSLAVFLFLYPFFAGFFISVVYWAMMQQCEDLAFASDENSDTVDEV